MCIRRSATTPSWRNGSGSRVEGWFGDYRGIAMGVWGHARRAYRPGSGGPGARPGAAHYEGKRDADAGRSGKTGPHRDHHRRRREHDCRRPRLPGWTPTLPAKARTTPTSMPWSGVSTSSMPATTPPRRWGFRRWRRIWRSSSSWSGTFTTIRPASERVTRASSSPAFTSDSAPCRHCAGPISAWPRARCMPCWGRTAPASPP